jgi:hypothetical protein
MWMIQHYLSKEEGRPQYTSSSSSSSSKPRTSRSRILSRVERDRSQPSWRSARHLQNWRFKQQQREWAQGDVDRGWMRCWGVQGSSSSRYLISIGASISFSMVGVWRRIEWSWRVRGIRRNRKECRRVWCWASRVLKQNPDTLSLSHHNQVRWPFRLWILSEWIRLGETWWFMISSRSSKDKFSSSHKILTLSNTTPSVYAINHDTRLPKSHDLELISMHRSIITDMLLLVLIQIHLEVQVSIPPCSNLSLLR